MLRAGDKIKSINAELRRGGPLVGRTPRRGPQSKAKAIKTETKMATFPSPERLRPLKPGSKLTFIPSLTVSTTDFDEIPFPVGKGQVREKVMDLLRVLRVLCGKTFYGCWNDATRDLELRVTLLKLNLKPVFYDLNCGPLR